MVLWKKRRSVAVIQCNFCESWFSSLGSGKIVYMGKNTSPARPKADKGGKFQHSHKSVFMRVFHSPVSPGAERQGGIKSLFREIRMNLELTNENQRIISFHLTIPVVFRL